ncbi:hypothetical protein KKF91_19420 [Myxococcota bacterium]|nr:hypothetical protein [Myxococcota bacterium]
MRSALLMLGVLLWGCWGDEDEDERRPLRGDGGAESGVIDSIQDLLIPNPIITLNHETKERWRHRICELDGRRSPAYLVRAGERVALRPQAVGTWAVAFRWGLTHTPPEGGQAADLAALDLTAPTLSFAPTQLGRYDARLEVSYALGEGRAVQSQEDLTFCVVANPAEALLEPPSGEAGAPILDFAMAVDALEQPHFITVDLRGARLGYTRWQAADNRWSGISRVAGATTRAEALLSPGVYSAPHAFFDEAGALYVVATLSRQDPRPDHLWPEAPARPLKGGGVEAAGLCRQRVVVLRRAAGDEGAWEDISPEGAVAAVPCALRQESRAVAAWRGGALEILYGDVEGITQPSGLSCEGTHCDAFGLTGAPYPLDCHALKASLRRWRYELGAWSRVDTHEHTRIVSVEAPFAVAWLPRALHVAPEADTLGLSADLAPFDLPRFAYPTPTDASLDALGAASMAYPAPPYALDEHPSRYVHGSTAVARDWSAWRTTLAEEAGLRLTEPEAAQARAHSMAAGALDALTALLKGSDAGDFAPTLDEWATDHDALMSMGCALAGEDVWAGDLAPGRRLIDLDAGRSLRLDALIEGYPEDARLELAHHALSADRDPAWITALPTAEGLIIDTHTLSGEGVARMDEPGAAIPQILALGLRRDGEISLIDEGLNHHARGGSSWLTHRLPVLHRPQAQGRRAQLVALETDRLYLAWLNGARRLRFHAIQGRGLDLLPQRRVPGALRVHVQQATLNLLTELGQSLSFLDLLQVGAARMVRLPWGEALQACWPDAWSGAGLPLPQQVIAEVAQAKACAPLQITSPISEVDEANDTLSENICACVAGITEAIEAAYHEAACFEDRPPFPSGPSFYAEGICDLPQAHGASHLRCGEATACVDQADEACPDLYFADFGGVPCINLSACLRGYLSEHGFETFDGAYQSLEDHGGWHDLSHEVKLSGLTDTLLSKVDGPLGGFFKQLIGGLFMKGAHFKIKTAGQWRVELDKDPQQPALRIVGEDLEMSASGKVKIRILSDVKVSHLGMKIGRLAITLLQNAPNLLHADFKFEDNPNAVQIRAQLGVEDMRVRVKLKDVQPTDWRVSYPRLAKKKVKKKIWILHELPWFSCFGYEFIIHPQFQGRLYATVREGELKFEVPTDEIIPIQAFPVEMQPWGCSEAQQQAAKDEILYFFYSAMQFTDGSSLIDLYETMGERIAEAYLDEAMSSLDAPFMPESEIQPRFEATPRQKQTALKLARMNLQLRYAPYTSLLTPCAEDADCPEGIACEPGLVFDQPCATDEDCGEEGECATFSFLTACARRVCGGADPDERDREAALTTLRAIPLILPTADLLLDTPPDETLMDQVDVALPDEIFGVCWGEAINVGTSLNCAEALRLNPPPEGLLVQRGELADQAEAMIQHLAYEVAMPAALESLDATLKALLDNAAAELSQKPAVRAYLKVQGADAYLSAPRFLSEIKVNEGVSSVADEGATLASVDTALAYTGAEPGDYASYDPAFVAGPLGEVGGEDMTEGFADVTIQEAALNNTLLNLQEAGAFHSQGIAGDELKALLLDVCRCSVEGDRAAEACELAHDKLPDLPLCPWLEASSPILIDAYLTAPDDPLDYVLPDHLEPIAACPSDSRLDARPALCLRADTEGDVAPDTFHVQINHAAVDVYGLSQAALDKLRALGVDLAAFNAYLDKRGGREGLLRLGERRDDRRLRIREVGEGAPVDTVERVAAHIKALEARGEAWLDAHFGLDADSDLLDGAFIPYLSLRLAVDAKIHSHTEITPDPEAATRCPEHPQLQIKTLFEADWTRSTRRIYMVAPLTGKAHYVTQQAGDKITRRIVDGLLDGLLSKLLYTPAPMSKFVCKALTDKQDECCDPEHYPFGELTLADFKREGDGGAFYRLVMDLFYAIPYVAVEARDHLFTAVVRLDEDSGRWLIPPPRREDGGVADAGGEDLDAGVGPDAAPTAPCDLHGTWTGDFFGTDRGDTTIRFFVEGEQVTGIAEGEDSDEGPYTLWFAGRQEGEGFTIDYQSDLHWEEGFPNYIGIAEGVCQRGGDRIEGEWRECDIELVVGGRCPVYPWRGRFWLERDDHAPGIHPGEPRPHDQRDAGMRVDMGVDPDAVVPVEINPAGCVSLVEGLCVVADTCAARYPALSGGLDGCADALAALSGQIEAACEAYLTAGVSNGEVTAQALNEMSPDDVSRCASAASCDRQLAQDLAALLLSLRGSISADLVEQIATLMLGLCG